MKKSHFIGVSEEMADVAHFFIGFQAVRNGDKFSDNSRPTFPQSLHVPIIPFPTYPQWGKSHTKSIIFTHQHITNTFPIHTATTFQNLQSFLFLIYENGDNYIAISDIM